MNDVRVPNKITISATSRYIPEKSQLNKAIYFFSYDITIVNETQEDIKLLTRHWDIIDANGNLEVVNGEGVIGKTPIIKAGDNFQYTSFCPLKTKFGSMKGFYMFRNRDGDKIKSTIPEFSLIIPNQIN